MTPALVWHPSDYYRARLAAHRGWVRTQPQYVIPGVLETADAAFSVASSAVSSPPWLASGAEPRCPSVSHRPGGRSRPLSPPDSGDASAPSTSDDHAGLATQGHKRPVYTGAAESLRLAAIGGHPANNNDRPSAAGLGESCAAEGQKEVSVMTGLFYVCDSCGRLEERLAVPEDAEWTCECGSHRAWEFPREKLANAIQQSARIKAIADSPIFTKAGA